MTALTKPKKEGYKTLLMYTLEKLGLSEQEKQAYLELYEEIYNRRITRNTENHKKYTATEHGKKIVHEIEHRTYIRRKLREGKIPSNYLAQVFEYFNKF